MQYSIRPATVKRLWPIGVFLLNGCAEPSLSFRGYTELSDCRNVIDAELATGASFRDVVDDNDLPKGEGVVTELGGELFTVPVRIFVTCYDTGNVGAVDYIAESTDPETSAAFFMHLSQEIDAIFGEPQLRTTAESRSRVYHCGDPATVILREAQHGEMDFEVSLLVAPRPGSC